MRVLYFDAKTEVYLEDGASMTMDEVTECVVDEICLRADIPQANGEVEGVEYSIQDITVKFSEEGAPVPDDAGEGGE